MFLVLLEWKTPWSIEQNALEATTVEAARILATRYKRPGIQVRIFEVSREVPLEAEAPVPEAVAPVVADPPAPVELVNASRAGS